MVDQWTGEWTEEKDYGEYPKEKWCDYDYMAAWIREQKYEPKTSMKNLITNIFLHYDCEIEEESSSYNTENGNFEGTYVEAVQAYVTDTGLSEFDHEAQIGVMEMKKYIVICYAVHEKEIASHDTFDNEDDAYAFLEKDAQNIYEEEMNNANEEDKDSIDFTIRDDGSAYLSSYGGEYEWTWEVVEA